MAKRCRDMNFSVFVVLILCIEQTLAAPLPANCSKSCGAFAQCFVYENEEFCAQSCAPGRCDDSIEDCILQGITCTSEPCLPEAVCEPRLSSFVGDNATGSSNCALNCQFVNSPVCGSNGITYANACFLKEASCTSGNSNLVVASRGLCAGDKALSTTYNPPPTPSTATSNPACFAATTCSDVLDPVCTSAGTMQNMCYFKREQRCGQATLTLVQSGSCEQSATPACPATCTQEYNPVCASNGQLYGNKCLFRQAKCSHRALYAVNLQRRPLSECNS